MSIPPSETLAAGTIRVEGLWERFRVYHSRPRGVRDRLFRFQRAVYDELWALRDVSFELAPGDTFAILGANGSGKSTLLKCLARILPPDRGEVRVAGTVASLLELGAGFQLDLTGRENIYLNGSILGLRRRRIDEVIEDIIDLSGVRDFIDTPVRNYSSGMHVRLGFAVAVHVDPDVLLVDEILAVGDAAFQTKCFEAMNDFKRRGKTMVLVTHDLDSAIRLCDRAVLLDHGEILADGPSRETAETYRRRVLEHTVGLESEPEEREPAPQPTSTGWGTGGAEIFDVDLLDAAGTPVRTVGPGDDATLRHLVRFDEDIEAPTFGIILRADDGQDIYVTNTMWRGLSTGRFAAGSVVEVRFHHRHHLLPGRYRYTCAVSHKDGTQWYHWWDDCLEFNVVGATRDGGRVHLNSEIDFSLLDQR